jgi:hypothetical protein
VSDPDINVMYAITRTTGMLALVAGLLLGLSSSLTLAVNEPACTPAVTTTMQAIRRADGVIAGLDVTTQADAARPDGDRLVSVSLARAANAVVRVNGSVIRPPVTIPLPGLQAWTFRADRDDASQPFQVDYTVYDLCGGVARFVGAGMESGQPPVTMPTSTTTPMPPTTIPSPTPVVSVTPTASLTTTPVASATPTASPTQPSSSDPGARIAPGPARLSSTFNSVGIEVPFQADMNHNATAGLSFRRVGESAWRNGLPLWPTYDPSGAAFYGSVLLLEPGTQYDILVTIADPDGVDGNSVQAVGIATRAETIPPPETLIPTHFVRAAGDDAADGRSPASAWRTLEKAMRSAPSGAVVQVGPGYFLKPSSERSMPLTLVAQYPAVDDSGMVINHGLRSVVEAGTVSTPAGSGQPDAGVWQQVTLTGPGRGGAPAGAMYTVWKWTDSRHAQPSLSALGYAARREDLPQRIALWKADTADVSTPAGWAEKLFTNQTYNYGAYVNGPDLYLRLPPNAPSPNPNDLYITAGSGVALALDGPGMRVSGLEIRQADSAVQLLLRATGGVVDHNLLSGSRFGVYFRGSSTPPSRYGSGHVVERNRIVDANLWTDDHVARPAIAWVFVKGGIVNADGTTYATSKLGASNETFAVGGRGGALQAVVRRNVIEGTFNGVSAGYQSGFDRYAGMDMDVYENTVRRIADDALEPEGQAINFRAWGNRIEQASTFLSTGPVSYGPVYVFRNEGWRIGNAGAGRDNAGASGLSGRVFKYSGTSSPAARVYVLHNTIWTDQTAPNTIDGGAQSASSGGSPEAFYLRNNVFGTTRSAFEAPTAPGRWDEDYDYFGTTATTRGLRFGGFYTTDVAGYRAASGQGGHTNVAGNFVTMPTLSNPTSGDLSLPSGSPLIDAGVPVPNVSDRAGLDYVGPAPDLGARER